MKYVTETTAEKVEQGKQLIKGEGGSIGDKTFDISGVSGRYQFVEGTLTVVVDDMPFLATESMIENKLNSFFS